MAKERKRADAPSEGVIDEIAEARDSPTLRASIFLLSEQRWQSAVATFMPNRITVRQFGGPQAFTKELSGSVGLAILSATIDDDVLRTLIKETVCSSEHARIVLIAEDNADLLASDVPRDEECLWPPEERFERLVKHVYVRAYYSATLQRFYKVSITLRNRELQVGAEEVEDDGRLAKLANSRQKLRSYLKHFRHFLSPEDLKAIADRPDRLQSLAEDAKAGTDPSSLGLPKSCPDCGFDWKTWHGPRLQNGYERLGANTWRCTRCSSVMSDMDPSNYTIG